MSNDQDAATHRVEWAGDNATFHCDGDRAATCHIYPDCECELWYVDPVTGVHEHPSVPHDGCWMLDWVNNVPPSDTWQGDPMDPAHVDGPVVLLWENGDVLWDYVVPLVAASSRGDR